MAATAVNVGDVEFETEDGLRWYDSTPSVQYGFCHLCGSSLFWRAIDKPDHLSITAGTLDTPTGLTTTVALFGSQASDYHVLDPELETFELDRSLPSND